jgi:H+/Na+-translocating ferredoxin:NAD+ oxidoreductase subunit G
MTHVHVHGGGPLPIAEAAATPSWRLLFTLGVAGALAGLLVVLVYRWTITPIEAHRGTIVQQAIAEVLQHPARWDTLYLENGRLTAKPTRSGRDAQRVFQGYDASGHRVGVAALAAEPGFAEVVSLIFAFEPQSGHLLGMKILDQKETPGLGEKIEKDTGFVRQFARVVAPLKAVKRHTGDASEVDVISGATISSRAVVRIINNAVARWRPLIISHDGGGTKP